MAEEVVVKRKRGRPRKNPLPEETGVVVNIKPKKEKEPKPPKEPTFEFAVSAPVRGGVTPVYSGQGGRPMLDLDQEQFEKLCAMQCTMVEIISWFGVNKETLYHWIKRTYGDKSFEQVFNEKKQAGFVALRRKQWQLAENSVPMAIFLGKNYLGQSDNQNVDLSIIKPIIIDGIDQLKD